MYKWQLRKGGRKEICPACGQRRFVPFVLSADNTTRAGREFGRCDRESNCRYFRAPDGNVRETNRTPEPPKPPIVFDPSVVIPKRNDLFDFVAGVVGIDTAVILWNGYKVGASADGRTIFWQIDGDGVVRSGKCIRYNRDGHRNKEVNPPVMWTHKMNEFRGRYTGEELKQCFYGEHLLKHSKKPVAVVESEKTAIVCAAFYPSFVWLACGGSQNLKNAQKNAVLAGRKVTLFPDHNQFGNWFEIALKYKFDISKICEENVIFEGCDLLDILVRKWKS